MPLNSHDPAPPRLSPSGRHNDGLPGFGESGQLAIGQWRAHNNYLQHGPRSRSASFCVILYTITQTKEIVSFAECNEIRIGP